MKKKILKKIKNSDYEVDEYDSECIQNLKKIFMGI